MHISNLYVDVRFSAFGVSKCRILLLLFCLTGICSEDVWAQDSRDQRLTSLIVKVDSLVSKHISDEPVSDPDIPSKDIDNLFKIDFSSPNSHEVQVINAEQKKLSRDIGLDLNAGYLENLEQGVFNVEGIYYRRRAQVEVEWDILNNGYLDNRHEIRELENEKKVAGFKHSLMQRGEEFDTLQYVYRYHFNRQKASIARDYLEILNDRHEVASELYELNYKPWEEVIEITSKRARTQVELENYKTLNRQFADLNMASLDRGKLPLVNIDLEKLLQAGQFSSLQDSIYSEQLGKIDHEYNSWRDISLSTFVRYNYYNSTSDINLSNVSNREYFSVGLNLSVPLPLQRSNNNEIAQAREDKLNAELARNKSRVRQELYADYSRYQEKLQQYIRNYEQYLQIQTRLDKQQQRKGLEDPAYSSILVLELLTERFEAAKDLLSIKQEMYEILLSLHERVPSLNFSQYLYRISAEDYFAEANVGPHKVYIWSSAFAEFSNEGLLDYLHQQQINHVLLSTGTDSSLKAKASSFIESARLEEVSVELMVGDNNLLLPGHEKEVHSIFKRAAALKAEGVHLDVEPHTHSDWDSREQEYMELYCEMLKQARGYADTYKLSLSVSIPVFYDSIISELVEYADEIYVMAYGTDNIGTIKERIEKERQATDGDLIVALRPEDFSSKKDFKTFMEKLSLKAGVNSTAIHDIEALMKLENTEITLTDYEE